MTIRNVVVSAVNLNQGGTLTVAKELLAALDKYSQINVTALVHKVELFPHYKNIKLIEFPAIKKSWLKRIFFEYYTSRKISRELGADIWFCAHDMSANVTAKKRYVYCHNPSPFYKDLSFSDLINDYKFWLFVHLYRFLYKINIKKNSGIFVQQQWIAEAFKDFYQVENVIVARPEALHLTESIKNNRNIDDGNLSNGQAFPPVKIKNQLRVFYPSVPRVFKNFEVLLKTARFLEASVANVTFAVTFDGTENRYARKLYEEYSNLKNVEFLGYLSKVQMEEEYSKCDVICFPSKLETWGLPITEAKSLQKPLILADLEYAHETVGKYDRVCFFSPDDHIELAELFTSFYGGKNIFRSVDYTSAALNGWDELVKYILKG